MKDCIYIITKLLELTILSKVASNSAGLWLIRNRWIKIGLVEDVVIIC